MTWLDWLQEHIRKRAQTLSPFEALDPDMPLSQLGIESLQIVDLIVEIENAYAVEVPLEYLTPETFTTTRAIWQAFRDLIPDR